jgi:peptide chain release factor 2
MAEPGFWQREQEEISRISQRQAVLREKIGRWDELQRSVEEANLLAEMAVEEGDEATLQEVAGDLDRIQRAVGRLELQSLLGDPDDHRNAILSINAGAGGTEAQDWVEMLFRMYNRWAESKGMEIQVIDYLPGEEAGIKSVTLAVRGPYAYGYLKAEHGIHRMVRISPFDATGRRHTSFASVSVLPEVDTDISVDVDEKNLRVDTYRASGPGGQHVNKTSSAVRITHLPTGIVVQCQNEKSQHRNKDMAMKVLKAKLYEMEKEKLDKQKQDLHDQQSEIAWGSQIRSYVFNPYRMVKDHRTNTEVGNLDAVMDGNLDCFIDAYLRQR